MKAYEIALFVVMFTAVGGIINDIGFMGQYELTFDEAGYDSSDFDGISGEINTGQIVGSDEGLLATDSKIGITSLLSAMKELSNYVLIKVIIMDIFASGLEFGSIEYTQIENIANVIQIGCVFVYMFAIVQLWRNSSIKHME